MHYSKANFQIALRRFLLGRAATGVLGLLFFALVLRQLQREEFGAYTAILAIQGGVAVLATLGIEDTLERFLPELRTAGNEAGTAHLIVMGIAVRMGVLVLLVIGAFVTMGWWAPWLSLQAYAGTLPLALTWLMLFGLMNTVGAIHEALLNQGRAQLALIVYASLKVGLFIVLPHVSMDMDGLSKVMLCEGVATLLGLLTSISGLPIGGLRSVLRPRQALRELPLGMCSRMLVFAKRNYVAKLVVLLYGSEALRLVASSQAGLVQGARFGAVHSLCEYIQRYLPAFMLLRLIRPMFVSRYTANRDFGALNAMGSIVLKINLAVLTPLLVFLVAAGDHVLGALSKGRYADAGWLLVAYVALLIPMSNQWVVSIIANTTEQNDTQVKAAVCAVPGILLGAWMVPSHGIAALVGGAWVSYLLYNITAVLWLRRAGFPYRPDWRALLLCAVAGTAVAAATVAAQTLLAAFPLRDLLLGALGAGIALAVLLLAGLFTPAEQQMLIGMLKRRSS